MIKTIFKFLKKKKRENAAYGLKYSKTVSFKNEQINGQHFPVRTLAAGIKKENNKFREQTITAANKAGRVVTNFSVLRHRKKTALQSLCFQKDLKIIELVQLVLDN